MLLVMEKLNSMYMLLQVITRPLLIILVQQYLLSLRYMLAQQYLLPLLHILAQLYLVPLPYIPAQPSVLLLMMNTFKSAVTLFIGSYICCVILCLYGLSLEKFSFRPFFDKIVSA